MKRSIVSPGFVKRTLAKLLKMDQQLGIVVDGNVASKAIAVGKYVNLINSTITGKLDGIYVATGAVSKNGTVTAADISGDAVADGVTNDLSEHIGSIQTALPHYSKALSKTVSGTTDSNGNLGIGTTPSIDGYYTVPIAFARSGYYDGFYTLFWSGAQWYLHASAWNGSNPGAVQVGGTLYYASYR